MGFGSPEKIWEKYNKIKDYCTKNELFSTVKRNEDFYDGFQWRDDYGKEIKTDMPKPVINVLQRIIKSQVSVISSNDVAISMTPYSDSEEDIYNMSVFSKQVEKVCEQAKIKENSKEIVKDAGIDGSAYLWTYFDPNVETGQDIKGIIKSKLIPNTQVFFGNPYSNDLQDQPYIIISLRQHIHQVKEEAKRLGVKKEDIATLQSDNDTNQANDDSTDLVTVLVTYYKKDGVVKYSKSTQHLFLIEDMETGYTRYPISCFGWDKVRNSYLYTSPITHNITNQIFINKCFSLAQNYAIQSGIPKINYDKNKININDFLENQKQALVGMDLQGKMLDFIKMPDMSNQLIPLANSVIELIKECMGSSATSLGDVKPENTSAIIALQEATNAPLELQRQQYYSFWEDTIRNIIDIMVTDYGERYIIADKKPLIIDFAMFKNINYELNIDIGSGAQYSEIAQINTADKLFEKGIVDPLTYVDIIPDKYVLGKSKIKDKLQQAQQQQFQQEAASTFPAAPLNNKPM